MALEIIAEKNFATIYRDGDRVRKCYDKPLICVYHATGKVKDISPVIDTLIANLVKYHKDYPESCAKILEINQQERWYEMEFLSGESVYDYLGFHFERIPHVKKAVIALATLVKNLHERGWFYGDLNWGAVMVNEDCSKDVRFCDVETIAPEMALNAESSDALNLRTIHIRKYRSREQFYGSHLLSKQGEAESIVLMLDELFIGTPYHSNPEKILSRELARRQFINYPDERMEKIPVPFRDILKGLIEYPRKDYDVDDILKAAKGL